MSRDLMKSAHEVRVPSRPLRSEDGPHLESLVPGMRAMPEPARYVCDMDIIIMLLVATVGFMIYKGTRPTVTVPLWGVAAVLTLGLLFIHMTDPLGLEF